MMKITRKYEYRVEVYPRSLGDFVMARMSDYVIEPDEEKRNLHYKKMCEEIASKIKQRIGNVASANVICDCEHLCSYCGHKWDEDENGLPLCCDEAQEEFKNAIHT